MEVYIIGAGGHARQVIDIFEENNYIIKGFFDDEYNKSNNRYNKYEIIGNIDSIIDISNINLFFAIGDNLIREQIYKKLNKVNKLNKFINCISPHAKISKNAQIGVGNYIGHNVIISGGTIIGSHNILNEACVIPHDCIIGDFNHISINSICGGNVSMGNLNLIGLNSTILPKIKIGNNNIIGAGSILTKSIFSNKKYCGNPAKELLTNY